MKLTAVLRTTNRLPEAKLKFVREHEYLLIARVKYLDPKSQSPSKSLSLQ